MQIPKAEAGGVMHLADYAIKFQLTFFPPELSEH